MLAKRLGARQIVLGVGRLAQGACCQNGLKSGDLITRWLDMAVAAAKIAVAFRNLLD